MSGQALDQLKIIRVTPVPAAHRASGEAQVWIAYYPAGIKKLPDTETVTARAGTDRIVKREQARFEFCNTVVADRTGKPLGEQNFWGIPFQLGSTNTNCYMLFERSEDVTTSAAGL